MATPDGQLGLFPELPAGGRQRRGRSRLFFALWPDRALRDGLEGAAALIPPGDSAAQRIRPENLHLTLAFLGELDARQVEAAQRAGDAVRADAFEFALDRVGHFAGANVAWIGPAERVPALARLKAELDRELLHHGLPVDTVAFLPHLTCLRRVREPPDAPSPRLRWRVEEFVLARSARDANGKPAGYKLLRRWPLRPG